MATNRIIQAVYDLKDLISAKLSKISGAMKAHGTQADKTAAQVERANKRTSDSYKAVGDSIGTLRKALGLLAGFAGFTAVKEGIEAVVDTGERLDDLRKNFDQVFGSVEKGGKALDDVRKIAQNAPQPFEDIAAAALKMRQVGLDPLDGSLQALIDNQNALNQSQEELIGTIEALGKANLKGEVNLKALVSLSERGVPVFDLLGNAMGISADRARQLAEDGKLGADSVKLIVSELGKLRAGVAADELGDTDAQLQKLKDSATEFLNTIAHSGSLDFFRDGLKELNDEVAAASKDGRLQALAKSISDGIVGTARAVKSAVGFVVEYSGAIIELGKAYLIFRGINIATSVAQGAKAMLDAGLAAKAASVQAGESAGAFGKLGSAIKGIPTSVKIFIAAEAIKFTYDAAVNLRDLLRDTVQAESDLADAQRDLANGAEQLARKIARQKAEFQQYASVQIESAEQLKAQSAEQLKAYELQLEGAKRYFIALQNEARNANDAAGLTDARERVAALDGAIAAVNAQLAVTAAVGSKAAGGLTEGAAKIAKQLDEVKDDAKAMSDVIANIFDSFDLSKPSQEIGDFALGFDAVAAKGGRASETLESTLVATLKKMGGRDLLQFQTAATFALDSVGDAGAASSATLRATLEAALDRLGVKAQDAGQKMTKAGADTIATFQAVAQNVQASSQTIIAAFDAALDGVHTKEEAQALGDALKGAAERGAVAFKDLGIATAELDERLRTITANLSPLRSQFEQLGIKSQAQLEAVRDNAFEAFRAIQNGAREGTAAQEDVVRAFKAYAEAARAAAADSTAEAKRRVEDQLAVQASVLGLGDALKKAGDAGEKAGKQTAEAYDEAAESIDEAGRAIEDAGNAAAGAGGKQDSYTRALQGTAGAVGGVIAVTADMHAALKLLNERLYQDANLTNLSLNEAKYLLSTLGPLAGDAAALIARRISELEAAASRAEDTARRMADQAASLQDQIDQLEGNDLDIEERRHQKALADLEAEAKANGKLNSAEYRKLVDLENKLHELKMKNLKKEKGGSGAPSGSGGLGRGRPSGPASSDGQGDGGDGEGDPAAPAPSPASSGGTRRSSRAGGIAVNITINGGMNGLDDKSLLEGLARKLQAPLKKIERLSR